MTSQLPGEEHEVAHVLFDLAEAPPGRLLDLSLIGNREQAVQGSEYINICRKLVNYMFQYCSICTV